MSTARGKKRDFRSAYFKYTSAVLQVYFSCTSTVVHSKGRTSTSTASKSIILVLKKMYLILVLIL